MIVVDHLFVIGLDDSCLLSLPTHTCEMSSSFLVTHSFLPLYVTLLQQFTLYARDVARASQASARSKYEVAESMALSTTSLALDKDLQFPFVTVPDFEVVASNARELSDTDLLAMCPLIRGREQRKQWEDYSVREQAWLRESLDVVGMTNVDPGLIPTEIENTRDFLLPDHNEGLHPDMIDMWAPLWYVSE